MSIFRVEKNSNYTVISNYHLRDKNLSLRTIGLLSLILSLPETWDYSQAGLASICKDGEDSIRSGLKELEKYGYLERERERDENGRMRGIIYKVYEIPKDKHSEIKTTYVENTKHKKNVVQTKPKVESPKQESPKRENPMLVNQTLELPTSEIPTLENEAQIINKKENKDILNTHLSTNQLNGLIDGQKSSDQRSALRKHIRANIGHDFIVFKQQTVEDKFNRGEINVYEYDSEMLTYNIKTLDQVVEYMLDILTSINNDPIKIGDEVIDREVVKNKLLKIGLAEMKRVIFALNTTDIKNPKKYAISMLYNS
jgi:hypothetical protein